MMGSIEHLVMQIESTAEWRRMKAEEYPDDSRNLEAAAELEKLANEINALKGSDIDRRIQALDALVEKNELWDVTTLLGEWLSEELRRIGFHTAYDGARFLEAYCDEFEERLQDEINPDLDEQVENDPAVKAAKQAYEEARAKAYAEARKHS